MPERVKMVRDAPKGHAVAPKLLHKRNEVAVCLGSVAFPAFRGAVRAFYAARRAEIRWRAENAATRIRNGHCGLRPLANLLRFVLSNRGQNLNGETVGERYIYDLEVHAANVELRRDVHGAGQPIKFGDNKRCASAFCMSNGILELRAAVDGVSTGGFDLDVLPYEPVTVCRDVLLDGRSLRLKAKARATLPRG